MESALVSYLWPIMTFGTIGAFIDFVIGRNGQIKIKDFLSRWWIRFDDVRWNNFGKKELDFAVSVFDKFFGNKIYAFRRWSFVILFMFALFMVAESIFSGITGYFRLPDLSYNNWWFVAGLIWIAIATAFNISLIRYATNWLSLRCSENSELNNFAIFIITLVLSYIALVVWSPFLFAIKILLLDMLYGSNFMLESGVHIFKVIIFFLPIREFFNEINPIKLAEQWFDSADFPDLYVVTNADDARRINTFFVSQFVIVSASYFPSLLRLFISFIFITSFIIKPIIIKPISLLWLRVIESPKPVFTLVLGGIGALATTINETLKHL